MAVVPMRLPWRTAAGIVCTQLNLADAVDFAATRCKQASAGQWLRSC